MTFMKKRATGLLICLFVFCVLMTNGLYGMQPDTLSGISFVKDPRIDQLLESYQRAREMNNKLDGFRIQIFFDSGNLSKRNATETRERFIRKYPGVEAYIDFKEPYYRVRVGDFRNRLEADGFRRTILPDFPNAFIVNDRINPPPIK